MFRRFLSCIELRKLKVQFLAKVCEESFPYFCATSVHNSEKRAKFWHVVALLGFRVLFVVMIAESKASWVFDHIPLEFVCLTNGINVLLFNHRFVGVV